MADQLSKIIEENPIGKGLDAFRASFSSICKGASVSYTPDAVERLGQEDLQNLAIDLLLALQILLASRLLCSSGRGKNLRGDLSRLTFALVSDDYFDLDCIKPLLKSAIANDNDALIWKEVYNAVTKSTPPPQPITSSLQQTPWLRNTSSFANSSEHRKYVDAVLKEELGPLYVGLRDFHETFFGGVAGLETASEAVFKKCMQGNNPLFRVEGGWRGWPEDADQDCVLGWFADLSEKLATFAEDYRSIPTHQRRPLAQPNKPIQGSTAERKLDIGFVDNPKARKDSKCHWSHILIPGELKSNPAADSLDKAWLDIGTYARKVLATQDTRRFILGFTICGSFMRIWEFDRLGGLASERFDISENGLRFVSTVLGFLWMNEEELGFDPTFITANGQRFIEIERNGSKERLIIDKVIQRTHCIAGRAATCWKAHCEGQPQIPLVIKDSWQYPERNEEGELLREVTSKGVINMARYYYHETVQIHGTDDDVRNNIRGRLDVTSATDYRPEQLAPPSSTTASTSQKGRSSSKAGQKRSSSQTGARLPPSKRPCSESPTKTDRSSALSNRVHRRIILRDYGKPIYEASSRVALLSALEGCIEGHESLHKAGFLHRDISINNLMINEDKKNPSWPSFLIDLDLAIKEERQTALGAIEKTGTRAFMAVGVLLGEQHSFMHDLESFFWVLFWICIHYNGPGKDIGPTTFDSWNYRDDDYLADLKKGQVLNERGFIKRAEKNFTTYYQPLIPWVNRLRRKVFPSGDRWEGLSPDLYSDMKTILREARKDLKVMAGR